MLFAKLSNITRMALSRAHTSVKAADVAKFYYLINPDNSLTLA